MEIESSTQLKRSGTTRWLLALTAVLTAIPVTSAVTSVLKAAGYLGVDREQAIEDGLGAVGFYGDERGLRIAEGYAAVLSIPVAVSCVVVLLGLLTWKEWAREAVLGVFGIGGVLLLVFSINGLTFDPPARGAGVGVLVGVLVLGVAVLAMTRPVQQDFSRRRIQQQLREREAATAARRARTG